MTFSRDFVERTYDRRAGWYDRLVVALSLGRDKRYRRAAVEALEAKAGERVLDVGCGTGRNFGLLPAGVRAAGMDLSRKSLWVAAPRERDLAQGDAERLPFRGEAFDRVLSTYVLTTVAGWRAALEELRRVLKPGGRLVLTDDRLPPGWFMGPGPMLRKLRAEGWVDVHLDVVEALRAGFRDVQLRYFHFRMIYLISATRL